MVERLPSAQGVILDPGIKFRIGVPVGSLLLPLPVSLPLSLRVSHESINKILKEEEDKPLISAVVSVVKIPSQNNEILCGGLCW